MRYLYLALLILFVVAFLAFAFVNRETVGVAIPFVDVQFNAPLFLSMLGVYLFGMLTGGTVIGFLRHSIRRASEHHHSH